jgi:hypothetical protein
MAWIAVQTDAAVLPEVGNLILTPGRRKENGQPVPRMADFKRHVQALVEAVKGAHKAALKKDANAVFVACEPLYQACNSCHQATAFAQPARNQRINNCWLSRDGFVQRRFLDAASNRLGECDYAGECERKLFAVYIT